VEVGKAIVVSFDTVRRAAKRHALRKAAFSEPARSSHNEDLDGFKSLKTSGARWRGKQRFRFGFPDVFAGRLH
jgi:hypothetical protein